MNPRILVDTSVLVYLFDGDAPDKREVARQVVDEHVRRGSLRVSAQVLGEFYVTVTRKFARQLSAAAVRDAMRDLAHLPFVAIDGETVLAAVAGSQEHTLSFWDALIVETARVGGCEVVLTEDMQDGREFGAVTIRNPFRGA